MHSADVTLQIHTTLLAIAQDELQHALPVPEIVQEALGEGSPHLSDESAVESLQHWLALLDLVVSPPMLRRYIKNHPPEDSALLALIRFWAAKEVHSAVDRDKVDWLFTYLFHAREERTEQPIGWPSTEMHDVLTGIDFPVPKGDTFYVLEELASLVQEAARLESFSQVVDSHLIQRARDIKNQLGEDFFHPDVLTAIVNYNLVFGKKFRVLFLNSVQKAGGRIPSQDNEVNELDARELLRRDYASTAHDFQSLATLDREQVQSAADLKNQQGTKTEQEGHPRIGTEQKDWGIDPDQEWKKLHERVQAIAKFAKSHLGATNIPTSFTPIPLYQWEAQAFRNLPRFLESDHSFEADFSRALTRTIGIISRIYEELTAHQKTPVEPPLEKQHYGSLRFLLDEGRKQKGFLQNLCALSQQRSFLEKVAHLRLTIQKLESNLNKLAAILPHEDKASHV